MALDQIRRHYGEMFQAEKKAADYILENPSRVIGLSLASLAKESGTSDATIIRMCRHVGFSGFYQLKISLASTLGKAAAMKNMENASPENVTEFFNLVAERVKELPMHISPELLHTCSGLISHAECVYLSAWGNTGEVASDFAHRLARKGIKSFTSDVPEFSTRSLALGNARDVLVAISHSGGTIHVIQSLQIAKKLGMKTILITAAESSEAGRQADHVLCAGVRDYPFQDLGNASHLFEYLIVDALLYFMEEDEDRNQKGDYTEFIMADAKY